MNGRAVFEAYVRACLCSDVVYEWDKLPAWKQARWEHLAAMLRDLRN